MAPLPLCCAAGHARGLPRLARWGGRVARRWGRFPEALEPSPRADPAEAARAAEGAGEAPALRLNVRVAAGGGDWS